MAVKRYTGGAPLVAQATDYVLAGTWLANETITFTVGSKTYTMTTGSTVITTILDNMIAAWAALDADVYPEFAEAAATEDGADTFTLTVQGDHVGKPIICTVATNSASGTIDGGASSAGTISTANSGPSDVGVARNYDDFALPANGDTLWVDDPDVELSYNLEALTAITTLTIHAPTSAKIGLPPINEDATAYPEYRPRYLKVAGATLVNIGSRDGDGSTRVQLDFGSALAAAVNVFGSDSGPDEGIEAVLLKGTNAANVFNVLGGEVGFAVFGGETTTLGTFTQTGGTVRTGAGCTLTSIIKHAGDLTTNSAIAAIQNFGGSVTINGTGAVSSLLCRGGSIIYNTSGTLGGYAEISDGALLTFDGDARTKAVTNPIEVYSGGRVVDSYQAVASVAQVNTYAFAGTWEATDEIKVDIFGETNTFIAGSTTTTEVIDNIVAAWLDLSAVTYPQLSALTPSRSGSNLILTAKSAGTPFMCLLTPFDTSLGAADDQRIDAGVIGSLGTVSTAAARLVLDFNEMNPGFGLGKHVRVYRAGLA